MNWLVQARKDRGMTQQDVADRCGITRQMVSAIERGRTLPSVPVAKAIASVLEIHWTKFFE